MNPPLVASTASGLFCEQGGFYIDPSSPVERAVLTHGHADHARPGSAAYLAASLACPVLHRRLGADAAIEPVAYGETRDIGGVRVSLHPAGHVLGSAQIRLESGGEVWVVSGDYKRAADPTCAPFEVVRCHTFITEATFALPIYRWESGASVAAGILRWWEQNRAAGVASLLFCYALGKSQRVLSELAGLCDRTVFTHGAVEPIVALYREAGVRMLPTQLVSEAATTRGAFAGELVLAPPSALGSPWMRRFGPCSTALASGWMRLRGARRRRGVDRGFVLSDHADWPSLLQTVDECGASRVLATHGNADLLARVLREQGLDAQPLATSFEGESDA